MNTNIIIFKTNISLENLKLNGDWGLGIGD